MQTCVKDGNVTMVMSYEEWVVMSEIIQIGADQLLRSPHSKVAVILLDRANKLDSEFNNLIKKELDKIPNYLKSIIRETPEIIQADITPIKEVVAR